MKLTFSPTVGTCRGLLYGTARREIVSVVPVNLMERCWYRAPQLFTRATETRQSTSCHSHGDRQPPQGNTSALDDCGPCLVIIPRLSGQRTFFPGSSWNTSGVEKQCDLLKVERLESTGVMEAEGPESLSDPQLCGPPARLAPSLSCGRCAHPLSRGSPAGYEFLQLFT